MAALVQGRTVGLAPKVVIPTAVLVAVGAVIAVLDLLAVIDVDDTLWLSLLGAAGVTGGTGFAAPAGDVQPPVDPDREQRDIHEAT